MEPPELPMVTAPTVSEKVPKLKMAVVPLTVTAPVSASLLP